MSLSRRVLFQLAIASVSTFPVMSMANASPLTVKDLAGRVIQFSRRPQTFAVANYIPNFLMVGGGESLAKIVALTRDGWQEMRWAEYSRYTEAYPQLKSLPSIGGYHDTVLNSEKIIALRPDVLLINRAQYQANIARIRTMEKVGIHVVVLDYHSMIQEAHLQSTKILGALLARESVAKAQCERYSQVMETIRNRLSTIPDYQKHRRVYIELGNEGVGKFGNTYNRTILWGGILAMLQADNIASDMKAPYGVLDREFVIAKNPQTIVMGGSIWLNGAQNDQMQMGLTVKKADALIRLKAFADRPQWKRLDAVRNADIHAVDHGSLRSMLDYTFFMYLARVLYPESFKDFDAQAEMMKFYQTYLPELDASGTYVLDLNS